MAENETGSKARHVLTRWWWAILLLFYVTISITYQAFVFPFLPGGTERYHLETDCFIVEIRFPLVLTVANQPGGEVSQPASFWVWKNPNPNAAVCDPEAQIAISHDALDLVWLEEKQEVSASWLLPVSNLREEAKPHQTFVYLAPQENLPSRAGLTVLVNQIRVDKIRNSDGTNLTAIPVNLWSASASGWFRLANLLLGSQNLTLLASILTVVGGIYKLFNDEQERRKQQQKEFDTALAEFEQRATQQPEQIANEYLDLLAKNKKSGISSPQQEQLKRKFKDFARQFPQGHIWARGLRLRLAEDLKFLQQDSEKQSAGTEQASRCSELIAWLEDAQKETEFLSDAQFQSLTRLLASEPDETKDPASLLQDALQVFRALGVESQPFIIKRINQAIEENAKNARRQIQNDRLTPTAPLFPKETLDSIKKSWFDDGKAAGHYLLESLTKTQPELRKALLKWEENDPAPPNRILPPFGLWGNDPVYETPSEVLKLFGETNPRWKHPFGPRKAEDDPRLPLKAGKSDLRPAGGLFWDEHPLWAAVLSLEPCFVTAQPGSGTSAMLRMGRHIRRFWGRKPALSLGLSLSGKAEMSTLWHNAERALSEALRRDLVEDPYWLLSANTFTQEWVISFFEHVYGSIWRLSSRLQEAGLPEEETDLIVNALHAAAGRKAYQGAGQFPELLSMLRQRLGEAARYRLRDDRFEVFVWAEVKDADFTSDWLNLLTESGLLQLGVAKIFSPAKTLPTHLRGALTSCELAWTEEQLTSMLHHRFKQTRQSALLDEMSRDIPQLVQEARRSPARLIELGNRKIQQLTRIEKSKQGGQQP